MKGFLILVLLFYGLAGTALAQDDKKIFAIYLVRHAEKAADPIDKTDPSLSRCGALRAESIATVMSDAGLEKIYSTSYERTMATARPSAVALDLEIETYDPQELESFAQLLLARAQDALVIGHSNTTSVLAGLLAGVEQEPFDEALYDRLYQVSVADDQVRMVLLHQAFYCDR
ncbi:histidine phosphatase family protein [Pseudomonadota bacterium]